MKKLSRIKSHNLKLWFLLALIPVVIFVVVYFFGNSFFDNSTYREDDATISDVKEDNYVIPDEKPDIMTHQKGKLTPANTNAKMSSDTVNH